MGLVDFHPLNSLKQKWIAPESLDAVGGIDILQKLFTPLLYQG